MSYKDKKFKPTQPSSPNTKLAKPKTPAQPKQNKYAARRDNGDIVRQPEDQMALNRQNFIFIICSGALIVIGFLLMLGPSSGVDYFEPDIFSTRRIVIGPLLAFLGFVAMAISIVVKGNKPLKLLDFMRRRAKSDTNSNQEK